MIQIVIVLISFFLDGLLSNLTKFSSLLYPLLSLLSLVVIYPYYRKKDIKKYYINSLVLGLCYDILYTHTLFLNMLFFLFLAILIKMLYNILTNNFYSTIFISFFLIICYRLFTYLLLLATGYVRSDIEIFFRSIYSSLIINIIYLLLCYYGTRLVSKKYHLYLSK